MNNQDRVEQAESLGKPQERKSETKKRPMQNVAKKKTRDKREDRLSL